MVREQDAALLRHRVAPHALDHAGVALDENLERIVPHGVRGDAREVALHGEAIAAAVREEHVLDQVAVDGGLERGCQGVPGEVDVHGMPDTLAPGKDLAHGSVTWSVAAYLEIGMGQARVRGRGLWFRSDRWNRDGRLGHGRGLPGAA